MRKIREVLVFTTSAAASTARSRWRARCRPRRSRLPKPRHARWEQAKPLSDAEVEAKLFSHVGRCEPSARAAIDFQWLHRELSRVGVTLQLLWGEYEAAAKQAGVRPYQYSQFCELYADWRDRRPLSMRQVHRPGEKRLSRSSWCRTSSAAL